MTPPVAPAPAIRPPSPDPSAASPPAAGCGNSSPAAGRGNSSPAAARGGSCSAASGAGAPGRLVAIASGKGGVGKTWFAITLAHALVQNGRRVLLFDGDLGLANVDIQLGLTPERDLGAVLAGRASLEQTVLRHAPGGFDILPGRSGSGALAGTDPASLDRVLAALRAAAAGYDLVLLDLGAGLEPPVRALAAAADTLLVLATEEPTSLTDAYAVLKLHAADRPGGDARVVVNQAGTPAGGARTYAALRRAAQAFLRRDPPLLGIVRRDEKVRETLRRQALLLTRHPGCAAAADMRGLARQLDKEVGRAIG